MRYKQLGGVEMTAEKIGPDGFPVPKVKQVSDRYACICPICTSGNATMKVAKNGNWLVRCPSCVLMLYLNETTSINLFRGIQRVFNENPEFQMNFAAQVVAKAPVDGE